MKKTLLPLLAVSALLAAGAAQAGTLAQPDPVVAEASFDAPAPERASKDDLSQAHASADAAQAEQAAGMNSSPWAPVIFAVVLVAVIIAAV
jgi:hypothetical protein